MIGLYLGNKLDEAYKMLDEAYVQAQKDSFITFDKDTIRLAKALDKCITTLDKARGWKNERR